VAQRPKRLGADGESAGLAPPPTGPAQLRIPTFLAAANL